MENLADKTVLKHYLNRAGVSPRTSAGQHFLVCQEVLEATLTALPEKPPRVTELGAGAGTLTQALLASGYHVKAIEKDMALCDLMTKAAPRKFKNRLQALGEDLRRADWTWRKPYLLVGNIPYHLSGFIVRKLTLFDSTPETTAPATDRGPELAILLVQKEVGQRLTAAPGRLSLIGTAVQLWGSAEKLLNVPAECFWPPPQVDSQLILLYPSQPPLAPRKQRELTLSVAKKYFQQKRKQMGRSTRDMLNVPAGQAADLLEKAGIDAAMRPQEVSAKAWLALASVVYSQY